MKYTPSLTSFMLLSGLIRVSSQCTELKQYDREVSYSEKTIFFGEANTLFVNGPIAAIFCKKRNRSPYCSRISLQSYTPNIPDAAKPDQRFTIGGGQWLPPLYSGSRSCARNKIVTAVECRGRDCAAISLQCSSLNSDMYAMGRTGVNAERRTTAYSRKTKCPTGTYMVGLDCEGDDGQCSHIQLKCAEVKYKSKDPTCSDNGGGNPGNPGNNCTDWMLPSGLPWKDTSSLNCDHYERWGQCSRYGNRFRNYYTANEACCACGGGSRN